MDSYEYIAVPEKSCHLVPDDVDDLDAALYCTLSHKGVRSLSPKIGDKIIVYGLAIGQISLQILNAHSCNAIGLGQSEQSNSKV